jgi:protein-S-isoprenylcysteine O-methyltransferase Ste14
MVMASLLAAFVPMATFETPTWLIAATATAGALFLLPAALSFICHKTTVNPQSPELASTLVTNGIYSVTRNPMYVGMLIMLAAFALWLGAAGAVLAVVTFFLAIDRFQIRGEEQALTRAFGKPFEDYVARIPRWLFSYKKRNNT